MVVTIWMIGLSLLTPMLCPAAAAVAEMLGLPIFKHQGIVLGEQPLKYNPHQDLIIPSVVPAYPYLARPLGRFYMYYAPHDAPGGICLAYADHPEGPWKEYAANPIIQREWTPHYKVSHVSGPHALWIAEEKKLFLYYHGENGTTRYASTTNGITFQYEGVAVTTKQFDNVTEASYARVFRYSIPGKDNQYVMMLMGNNNGTRRIYLAWSKDGRSWQPRRAPLINPPVGTDQIAQAWYWPWHGKHYVIFHGHRTKRNEIADLYLGELDETFEKYLDHGLFYEHTSAGQGNVAQMSPCLVEENGKLYLYTNVGPRLKQKIALAIAP